jgi:uncharacterized protein (TIRG00374 family)
VRDKKVNIWNKAFFRNILGFGISGFLLWLTIKQSGLEFSSVQFSRSNLFYFSIAEFLFVVTVVIYAVRAKLIWRKPTRKDVSARAFESIALGNFYSSVLPANLGEGVRAWHFAKKNNVSLLKSIAAIITEKWLDAQIFVFLSAFLFLAKPFVGNYISYSILFTAITAAILSIVYLVLRNNRTIEKLVWRRVLILGHLGKFLYKLYLYSCAHIDNITANKDLLLYMCMCITIFSLNMLQFFFLMKTVGIQAPVCGFYTSLLIAVSMMIIAIVPSAPGNIGVLHYGVYSALVLSAHQHGTNPSGEDLKAYALFGIYLHLSYLIPDILIGLVCLWRERHKLFESNLL